MKSIRASAFFLLAVFSSIAVQAADFKVLLDLDNQATTGCSVTTGAGTFAGVDAVLTTTVDTVGGVQRVLGVSRQQCVNGSFGAAVDVDSSGWAVGTDPTGGIIVETRVPVSQLSANPIENAHVAFVASSGGLADVILSHTNSTPILFPEPAAMRRRAGPGTSRTITMDGDLSDWGMIAPLVDGNASTGSSNFRFTNIFGYAGETNLYFAFQLRNNGNAPTAVEDNFFVLIGHALNVAAPGILGNDISPNGASLSAILVSGPQHGALTLNANGSFVYLHDGSSAPEDSFRYKVTNGTVESNAAQVRIDITTNTAPTALPDGYSVAHAGTLTVPAKGVLTNDSDADGDTLHAQLVTNAQHGTVTLNSDGSFTYTHDGSNSLSDSFTYRAIDSSSSSNAATVSITIAPDVPAVAVGEGYTLLEGATLTVPAPGLFANDSDTDTPQSQWTAVVVTPPAHGNLTMLPGGGFTYVNDSVTGASDSFQYRINDGISPGNTVTVALTVTPVNDAPVFAANGPVTVLDTDGAQSIPFVSSANGGASDELGQVIDYIVSNDNNALFSVQPSIDAAGVLHFTPIVGMSGVANLTIQAHDNGGVANGGVDTSAPQSFAVNVDKIPSITSANTTTFLVGQAGTFTVTTSGLPQPSIAETGALPAGVTFVDGTGVNKGTGVLSGTPAPGTGGSYPITFQATNPHGSSPIQNFTLIVNQPPAITSASNAIFTRNQAGTFTITTTGYPNSALTETGALPAGLTFTDNSDGTATLAGTPTAVGGLYSITVNANNGVGPTVQQTLTITINDAPAITSGNATNFQATTPGSFLVTTTGFPAPSLSESSALPAGITFTDNGNGTATLGGTAANGSGGVYSITITATNVAGSAPQSFTITVCNNIVVTAPGVSSATAGSAFSQTFTQSGAVGGATFATSSTLPTGITLSSGGVLSGTPTQVGSFPIVVTVTDGNGCTGTSGTYTLVVGCQTITVTNPGVNSGTAGAAFSQTFTQSGAIGGATFTTSSTLPAGLTLSSGGVLSGTPTQTGSFPIVVTVTDGNGCTGTGSTYTLVINCQTITVTNPGVNSGTAGAAFSQTFTESGSIGGATFTTSSTLPAGLTLSSGGVLSGTPTQVGSFPIVVTVTDGNGCTGSGATYTLTINCQTITVTNPGVTTGTVNAAFSQTFTQSGGIGTVTFTTASTLPAGITLAPNGVLSGTPTQTGSFPIVVTVTDANGCTGTGSTYTLVINCQTIPVTNPGVNSGTVNVAFSQTFTQTGGFGTVTFTTASTLPTGLSLAINGTLAGIPTQTGSFPIVVTATDSNGCTGTGATYTLTINCQVITVTNPVNNTGAAGSPFSETFTQSGAFGSATFTTASTLPTGLTLSTAGVLSGTPMQGGTFPIVVTVTDANGCTGTGSTYNLTITCPVITVTNPGVNSGTAGVAFSQTFTQTGAVGGATFTTASTLPTGFTLSTGGVLSGTTTEVGTFPIVVTVTDGNGCTGTGSTYNLTINCQTVSVTNPGVNTGTVDAAFTQTFTVTGILGSVTWSETGSLPVGITLDSSTGVLSGTPTVPGTFPITVKATDTNGCFGTSSYTLTISCQTITVTNPGVTTGTVDAAFSQTFTQTGAHGTATFTTSSPLPGGITLSTGGVLSGAPTQTGSFPIVVTVTDSNGCTGVGTTYTLVISCQTITVTNPGVNTGTVNAPFSQTFTQLGAHASATFTTASTLPTGITLSTAGVLSGTTLQHGTFPIVVTVTDANGCTGTGSTYNLTINCQTITVTNPVNTSGTVASPFSEMFTQTGAIGGATFTTASTLPTGITLATDGTLSGTPTQSGSFPIVVTVTDGGGCTGTSSTYTLVISCNVISVTNPVNNLGTAGSAFSETFTQTGGNGTITWSLASGSLPAGITLNTSTGVLSGVTTVTGSFPITITATDSNGCTGTGSTYTLTINCQTITVTNPGVNTVQAGVAFDQAFTATGILGTATWSETGALPTGITLNTSTGHLTGSSTQLGAYSITVTATDTNGCSGTGATYTLTVTCPVITVSKSGPPTFPTGVLNNSYPVAQNVVATGGTGPYTYVVASGALPGGLTLSSGGNVSGTPTATGTFTFTVTATDANTCQGTSATLTIKVAPQVNDDTFNGVGNTQFIGVNATVPSTPYISTTTNILSNDVGPGLSVNPVTDAATVQGGKITLLADGSFDYRPAAGFVGTDQYTYGVSSNGVTSASNIIFVVTNKVWYVKNNYGSAGTGVSSDPFQKLAGVAPSAENSSGVGDIIYVMTGDGTTLNQNAGITLKANQQLIGQGVALVVNAITIQAAGTKPQIGNAAGSGVVLAAGNTVKGLTVTGTSGNGITGLSVAGFTGDTLTLQNAGAGSSAILLATMTGTVTLTNTAISNSPTGLNINGGTATITVDNTNTINASAGQRSVSIINRGVGATGITIGAAINDSGIGMLLSTNSVGTISFTGTQTMATTTNSAVTLTTNVGSTITFSGTLGITTTTGSGFVASGGGTLNVGGAATIATGAAANALSLNGMTIGAGVTFNSINSTGATTAIALTNVAGLVTVNGGTLTNGTTGISLQGASTNLTLANVTITGPTTGISSTGNFGTLTIGSSVSVSAATALNLTTGAITGTFANVTSTGGTNGVSLTAVTGSWGATAGALSGASGATFNVSGGGSGTISWGGTISQANAATAVTIAGSNSNTINFTANVTSSGNGISIGASSGTYSFTGGTNALTGAGGIAITSATGSISFNSGTSINVTGTSFAVTSSSATITYSGTVTQSTAGAKLLAIDTYSAGTLTMNGTSLSGSVAAPTGVISTLNNITGTVVINNLSLTSSHNSFAGTLLAITGTNTGGSMTFNHLTLSANGTGHTGKGITAVGGGTLTITATGGVSSIDAGSTALDLNGQTLGTSAIGTLNSLGVSTQNGVLFTNVTGGPLTIGGGAITGNTASAFKVSGGTPTISYAGTITQNTAGQRAIDVVGMTGGTLTFSGAIGSTGSGVFLNNNTGATINVSGVMTLSTATAAAFTATGGGIVNVTAATNAITTSTGAGITWNGVTGTSTETFNTVTATGSGAAVSITSSGATNFTFGTISSQTGTAVAINTSTGDFVFTKISSNGAAKGISVNALTGGGSFIVNGTGGLCDATHISAADCTGGSILGGTTRGAEFINAAAVTLNTMYFKGNGTTAVACGDDVNGGSNSTCNANLYFATASAPVLNKIYLDGTLSGDSGLVASAITGGMTIAGLEIANFTNTAKTAMNIQNLAGTVGVTGLNVHNNNVLHNVMITNNTGTANITFTSPIIQNAGGAGNPDGLQVNSYGGGTILNVTSNNGTFNNVPGNGVMFQANSGSNMTSVLSGGTATLTNGLLMQETGTGTTFNFTVTGLTAVTTHNLGSNAITVGKGNGTGTFTGTVTNNVITSATCGGGCAGIKVASFGTSGSSTVNVSGNNIAGVDAQGIWVVGGQGASSLTATVQNNNIHNPVAGNTSYAIDVYPGTTSGDAVCFALNLGDMTAAHSVPGNRNTITGTWQSGGNPIEVGIFNNSIFKLLNYPNPNTNDTNAANWVAASNGSLGTDAFHLGTNQFTAGASCP